MALGMKNEGGEVRAEEKTEVPGPRRPLGRVPYYYYVSEVKTLLLLLMTEGEGCSPFPQKGFLQTLCGRLIQSAPVPLPTVSLRQGAALAAEGVPAARLPHSYLLEKNSTRDDASSSP